MIKKSGQSVSVWMATHELAPSTRLAKNLKADVCVIGAGIAGMTAAYVLSGEGVKVVLLDDGRIGSGETRRTTAHLSSEIDDGYAEIEKGLGRESSRLVYASHSTAIDFIEETASVEGIDCGFERLDGYLFLQPGQGESALREEYEAFKRAAGENIAELLPRAPIGGYDTGLALRFSRQAQFHPLRYLDGLRRAFLKNGGEVYTAHAKKIQGGRSPRVTTVSGHKIDCGAVFVCTNTPVNNVFTPHTKQAPYRTYAVGLTVPKGSVEKALYWDTGDPYHYVRVEEEGAGSEEEILIVGGEDHKTGQARDTERRYGRLEEWARERFAEAGKVRYQWSGQVMETLDGLAYIGRNPNGPANVYIATGDSGMGMTHGTIAGILLPDLVRGRKNIWETLYDPARKGLRGLPTLMEENMNVAARYADWFKGGEVKTLEAIAPGEGAVVRNGMSRAAVYRDEAGDLHACSAVCPHLGCIVKWNGSEKTWDCPCHGSRFDREGAVLNGPSNKNLKKLDEKSLSESPARHNRIREYSG